MSRGHSTHNDEPAAAAETEPAAPAAIPAEPAPAPAGEPAPAPQKPLTLEERVAKLEAWIPRLEAIVGPP